MNSEELKREIQRKKDSITPTTEQLMEICKAYSIGNLVSVIEIIPGTVNPNIKLLTSRGLYVIKIFHARPERLDFTLKVLKQLTENNVPALTPLKNVRGVCYGRHGEKAIQVTEFVEGCSFCADAAQVRASGRMLRVFHDALSDITKDVEPAGCLYPSTDTVGASINKLKKLKVQIPPNIYEDVLRLYNDVICYWNQKGARLPSTIIHGDWHMGNQLFTKAGEVKCILDFDFMKKAERLFDIAYTLWYLHNHYPNTSLSEEFLCGYGPLLAEEIRLLPLEIARINTFFLVTSMLSMDPLGELNRQYEKRMPHINWLMTPEGERKIRNLCKRKPNS